MTQKFSVGVLRRVRFPRTYLYYYTIEVNIFNFFDGFLETLVLFFSHLLMERRDLSRPVSQWYSGVSLNTPMT